MKNLLKNLFNVFGKYIGLAIILFMAGALYYFVWRDGIQYFYYPVIGIFTMLGLPSLAVIYYLYFIRKKSGK